MGNVLLAETTAIDLSPVTTALTTALTPAQLLSTLGTVIGIGMGFVIMWFGVRKAISVFSAAVFKGRIRA